ncbi:MAG: hypothetical protein IPK60_04900 [Sandaracinaceae bacterium]|nr:hypothetical protein [Sandaracinaceae bacterium]
MKTNTPPPTPKKVSAAELLGSGHSLRHVAQVLGVHRATLHRWKSEPEFRQLIDGTRKTVLELASEGLVNAVPKAVDALLDIVNNAEAPAAARVRAAEAILDRAGVTPNTAVQHNHAHVHVDLSRLTEDELDQLRALRSKLDASSPQVSGYLNRTT